MANEKGRVQRRIGTRKRFELWRGRARVDGRSRKTTETSPEPQRVIASWWGRPSAAVAVR